MGAQKQRRDVALKEVNEVNGDRGVGAFERRAFGGSNRISPSRVIRLTVFKQARETGVANDLARACTWK